MTPRNATKPTVVERRSILAPWSRGPADEWLIVFFNDFHDQPLELDHFEVPGVRFSSDPGEVFLADVVVVHIPGLVNRPVDLPPKVLGQKWIAWSLESVANYPPLDSADFDLKMSYQAEADIWTPYFEQYGPDFLESLTRPASSSLPTRKVAAFISSMVNHSHRIEYLRELGDHIEIDHYGSFMRNQILEEDRGTDTKMDVFSKYRFCIAFENSIAPDYLTEKFYDPLRAGSIPVYLGAPNVHEYSPHENAFVDVRKFAGPPELADHLQRLCTDNALYEEQVAWRQGPLDAAFVATVETHLRKPHTYVQLAEFAKSHIKPRTRIVLERSAAWRAPRSRGGQTLIRSRDGVEIDLNEPMRLSLEMCDGRTSMREIVDTIADLAPTARGDVARDVAIAITNLDAQGVIAVR